MNPVHENFSILLDIGNILKKKIVYVSDLTPDRRKWFSWVPIRIVRQICFQFCTSLDMTKVVLKSRSVDAIFIFEHKPQYSFLLYLLCVLKNVPVFFIVHGIQQAQRKSIFHFCGGELLRALVRNFKFWPIHLEISDENVPEIRRFFKSIVIPHPLARESVGVSERKNKKTHTSIGIVGILRDDKPIFPILKVVLDYAKVHENVELYIGTPFWQNIPAELKNEGIKLVDTTSREQYFTFLEAIDIVVTDFDRDSFYFRPSGIINDSVSCGCFVIAPDFPVFKAQLSKPVKVGETYHNLEDLSATISKAVIYTKTSSIDYRSWVEARSDTYIFNSLAQRMQEIIGRSVKKELIKSV